MLFTVPSQLLLFPEEMYGRNIEDLMRRIPDSLLQRINSRAKWKVNDCEGGGVLAYAILGLNPSSRETLILGAIGGTHGGAAPEHEHVGGETILTLAGVGIDIADGGECFLRRGSIIVHGAGTIHAPSTERFWAFVYYQPMGMRLTNPKP